MWNYAYTRNGEIRETVDPAGGKTVTGYNLLGQQDLSWTYEGSSTHYNQANSIVALPRFRSLA